MSTSVGEAFLAIVPDLSRFKGDLTKQVEPAVASASKRVGQKMQKTGLAMTAGLTVPLVALGKSALSAFEGSEKITAQTAAAIKSTGGAAHVSAQQVKDLASTISGYSGISGGAVRTGENMLLTFTNIRDEAGKTGKIFDDATRAVADMSTALGTDTKSAAMQLGKALNDPVKGVTKLQRVGVTFTDQQKKVIARLAETGDTAGAQRVILDELGKEFGGSAKAFGDTTAGAAAKAQNSMRKAMVDIGASIAPVVAQIAALVSKLAGWFSSLPSGAKTAIVVLGAFLAILGPLVSLIGTIITIAPALGAAFSVMLGPVGLIVLAVAALIVGIVLLIKHWQSVKRVALAVWHAITGAVSKAWHAITGAFKSAIAFLKRNWPTVLAIITGPIGLAVLAVVKNWQRIKAAAGGVIDWLKGAWHAVADVVRSVFGGIRAFVGGVFSGIGGAIRSGLNVVVTIINELIRGANVLIHGVNLLPFHKDMPYIPEVPALAHGGLVLGPTLALIGEHGPEAVVPLDRMGGGHITGELTLTPDSRAYVAGVVWHEGERTARHARAVSRMGRRPA